jgi:hypothetical protein
MGNLYNIQTFALDSFSFITIFVYILTAFGIAKFKPKYLETLDFWIRIYVALFLLIRFHPFANNIKFTELDRKIAFNAGIFLATTIGMKQILYTYVIDPAQKKLESS